MNIKAFKFSLVLVIAMCMVQCSKKMAPSAGLSNPLESFKMDIGTLADDKMEGRETGQQGESMAAEYIVKRFSNMGIPAYDGNSYFHFFEKIIKANPHDAAPSPDDTKIRGKNVVGMLDNGAPGYIVIGAHYDHLGYGQEGSLYTGPKAIHNGADDNASGVSMMLVLADHLQNNGIKEKHNFIFIGFSGEEKGLWGSNAFAKDHEEICAQASFMINMDMVGRLNEEKKVAINGTGTSPLFDERLKKVNRYGLELVMSESGVGPSDHTSFYLNDVPALHFFTGQHEDYHKPSDDADKINYEGMETLSSYIYDLVLSLDKEGDLPFTKTKDESAETPRFEVTLGVVPDYLFNGQGMRIDGVREDRPAIKAGIKKGDIVVKMGDLEVVDMMSYMKGLSSFQPGQTVTVTIIRDGKEMEKTVTF
jgi:hypothetical protein